MCSSGGLEYHFQIRADQWDLIPPRHFLHIGMASSRPNTQAHVVRSSVETLWTEEQWYLSQPSPQNGGVLFC
jgi:hypothetical protein